MLEDPIETETIRTLRTEYQTTHEGVQGRSQVAYCLDMAIYID